MLSSVQSKEEVMHRLLLAALLAVAPLLSATAEQYSAGRHYWVLPEPIATESPAGIEVIEVFWYGCSHCYRFSGPVALWQKQLPEDIHFARMPAVWHPKMALHARAYFAAEAMSVADKMHSRLFDAIHSRGLKLDSEWQIAALFADAGVDRAEFSSHFNSFRVKGQVLRAEQRGRDYLIISTPSMIVNGKYRVTVESAGSRKKMLAVVEYLVNKERRALVQR